MSEVRQWGHHTGYHQDLGPTLALFAGQVALAASLKLRTPWEVRLPGGEDREKSEGDKCKTIFTILQGIKPGK